MAPTMTPREARAALATLGPADFPTSDEDDDLEPGQLASYVADGRRAAGRPSLTAPGAHSPQITVRIPESTNARLTSVARRTGQQRSQIVREALDRYLATA